MSSIRSRVAPSMGLPSPPVGALLAWAAAAIGARAVVEVGTAAGLTTLWLLRGMPSRAMLTSVEPDPERHALTAQAIAEADVGARVRSIPGEPAEVLSRLADGAYDLIVVNGPGRLEDGALTEVRRILRAGGSIVALDIGGTTGRSFVQDLLEDQALEVAVLPFDHGVALATSGPEPSPPHDRRTPPT